MKIRDFERNNGGESKFTMEASNEETSFLLNLALDVLINAGKLTLEDLSRGEFELDLSTIPMEDFYNAS